MRNLIRRLAASNLKVQARVKMGCDCVDMVSDGGDRKVLLNGYETVSDGGAQGDSMAPMLADMLSQVFSGGKGKVIMILDGGSDGVMQDVAARLRKSLGDDKVSLKGIKGDVPENPAVAPAEFKVDDSINMGALGKNVGTLANKLASVAQAIDTARDAATMIFRKRLVESMWGAPKVQSIIDGVRDLMESPSCHWSKVSVSADVVSKSADRLQRKFAARTAGDDSMLANVLIPGISDGYCTIKAAAARAAVSLVPLVYIDDAFQKNTTYPATWFYDQNVLDGVSQGYDGIVKFLVQVPAMESKVVDPLSCVRMRMLDDAR